jgi:glycosyltransferase involved in cell wall biosynthesis
MSVLEPSCPAPASSMRPPAERELLLWEVRERFPARRSKAVELSLVAPVFEEEENLERLHARVAEIFGTRTTWELVLVDDGSKDRSAEMIREMARRDPRVIGVFFGRNRGQTAATAAGVHLARGRLIATLDADLQNDPADLPKMIELIEGHDAVVGWRMKRRDTFVRRASSRIANGIRNWISKDTIKDTGCSLKVFRAEAIQAIPLFEGMHRFLPTLLRLEGARVVELPVRHHPRVAGRSKYGIGNRMWSGLRDCFAVRWMRDRQIRYRIKEDSR